MLTFDYRWTHPSTGTTGFRKLVARDELDFLRRTDNWNRQAAGRWLYWRETPPSGAVAA